MSTPDWKEDWIAAELAAEAELADPPPEAADRVLKGVLATVATGATVAGTAGTGVAAASATTAGASALWVKGLLLTGLVAGGIGVSQLETTPTQSTAPRVVAQPARVAVETGAPARTAPPVVQDLPGTTEKAAIKTALVPAPQPAIKTALVPAPQPVTKRAARSDALTVHLSPETNQPVRTQAPTARADKPVVKTARPTAQPKRPATRPRPSVKRASAMAPASIAARTVRPPSTAAQPATTPPATVQSTSAQPTGTRYLEVNEPPQHRASTVTATDAELRVQRRILTRALKALRNGQPRSAQVYLRDYRRRFAAGRLDEEHRLIAVRVHLALGEKRAARTAADAFLQRYPNSALRSMIERLRP